MLTASLRHIPINAHNMWWPCCSSDSSEQWRPEGRQKIITALITLPPGRVSVLSVSAQWYSWQCSQNIHGPLLRAVLPMQVEESARAMTINRQTKALTARSN